MHSRIDSFMQMVEGAERAQIDLVVFADVRRAVNAADPARLIIGGTPDDEYDPEVVDLARLCTAGPVSGTAVWEVFVRWFSEASVRPWADACWEQIAAALRVGCPTGSRGGE